MALFEAHAICSIIHHATQTYGLCAVVLHLVKAFGLVVVFDHQPIDDIADITFQKHSTGVVFDYQPPSCHSQSRGAASAAVQYCQRVSR